MLVAWAQSEIIRFTYYSFPSLQNGIIGHLRYNLFVVMYPLGVGAELLVMWSAKQAVAKLPVNE